jgi:ABC-2 type transport system ATP-binding protein
MSVIEIRELSLTLGGVRLFSDASAVFEQGRTYGLVGPNGSGKSVLRKLICGFLTPSSGEVIVDPAFLSRGRTFPERFGIAIDGPAYLPNLTGLGNLQELADIRKQISTREIRAIMQQLDLDPDSKQKVRNYSLGMKQKLSLAQALMEDPDVLLLDEPFNGLDAKSVVRVKVIVGKLHDEGKTMIFTSHNAADIVELSDDIVEIDDRKLVASASRPKPAKS